MMRNTIGRAVMCAAILLALSALGDATVRLSETGSTLLYPIMTVWIARYDAAHSGVRIDATASGSGAGIKAATAGSAEIGASDAYLSDVQMKSNGLLNIPLAVSAQEIAYNVPELHGTPALRLTGRVLARMYDATITMWDDPAIAALNPSRTLPHRAVHPVHRTDGSGDTFLFTQFLSLTTPSWDQAVHFGTTVQWPTNMKALEGTGNAGVIEVSSNVPYALAYIGISYSERALAAGLDVAALQNRTGEFVLPTTSTARVTAQSVAGKVPDDGRFPMIFTAGAEAYPLVNFEYAVVKSTQTVPGRAEALRDFLAWIVAPASGNDPALLAPVHFAPLPERVRAIAMRQIASISGP
jgi:phosphate transport system substrate-binding protein